MAKNTSITDIERRSFKTELRMEGEGESRKVVGYAAVFDSDSEIMWDFKEQIDKRAFDEAIPQSDVRALFNHNPDHLLGRTKSGTLSLSVDERGLKYEFDAPDTTLGNDILEMLKRGDLDQSSFGFTVDEEKWNREGEIPIRIITKVKRLYDVSPVTYPAYNDTTVAKRHLSELEKEDKPEEKEPKKKHIRRKHWR